MSVITEHSRRKLMPHKLLTLVVSVAAGLVIAAGADSATASALCESEKVMCPYSEAYVTIETWPPPELSGLAQNFVLEAEKGKITCAFASIVGEAGGEFGEPEEILLNFFVSSGGFFTKCFADISGKKTECTSISGELPGSLAYTSSGDGVAQLDGEPGLLFSCGSAVNCTYSANPLSLDVTGAVTPKVQASNEAVSASGATCLGKGTLSATFELFEPEPMFVAEKIRPTAVFCKKAETPCSTGELIPPQTGVSGEAEAESKFIFEYNGVKKEPACKVSTFAGTTRQELGETRIAISSLLFSECGGGLCNVTGSSSWGIVPTATGGGNGTASLVGTKFQITGCPEAMKCIYGPTGASQFTVTGGSPMKFSRSAWPLLRAVGSDAACSTNATWEGVAGAGGLIKYKILSPSPLFVTS